jgi:xanthine dehydrogenase accessory factor
MEDVIEAVAALEAPGVLATLVESSGSIPMSERAKMLVRADGSVVGTIGGGCLEAEILAVAGDVLRSGDPQTTSYTMTEQQAGEHGLNCGGTVRIYCERLGVDTARAFYGAVATARRERRPTVLATQLGSDRHWLRQGDGGDSGSPGDEAEAQIDTWAGQVLDAEEPALFEGSDGSAVFVEPYAPPPLLYVFGGGHVGGQIARLGRNVGFHTVVVDDRPYFANAERHPDVDETLADDIDAVFDRIVIDEQTYIVAATRGHAHDELVVERAVRTPARYIGMLGSERKKLILWDRIESRGGEREALDRVWAPIGFNIGADTPEEIAVAVVGEMIEVRRGAKKRWRTKRASTVRDAARPKASAA